MTPSRDVVIVACTIIQMIPESETQFRSDLKGLIMDFSYSAPELLVRVEAWHKLEAIMHKHIPIVDTPLKKKIVEEYIGGPLMA
uniref:Uncharacterized protein n=1 Tax=viral metagenome TaxID=1070528 RepID=A0A6C0B352_9ZZZZ